MTNVFQNKIFQDFIEAGLVTFDEETVISLNQLDGFTDSTYSFSGVKTEIVVSGIHTGKYTYNGIFYNDLNSDGVYTHKVDEVVGWRACNINEIIPYVISKIV